MVYVYQCAYITRDVGGYTVYGPGMVIHIWWLQYLYVRLSISYPWMSNRYTHDYYTCICLHDGEMRYGFTKMNIGQYMSLVGLTLCTK